MKKKYSKNYIFFFFFLLILPIISVKAQQYKRIESLANLGELKNNSGVAIADYDLDNDLDIFIVGIVSFN